MRASSRSFAPRREKPRSSSAGRFRCELVEGLISHPREAPQLVCGEASVVSLSSGEVTIPGDEHRGIQGDEGKSR